MLAWQQQEILKEVRKMRIIGMPSLLSLFGKGFQP
jgi:hypothetical protein